MARPNMVRADTLDLQDQGSPSAGEHPKQPATNGLAPHQASQIKQVFEERHSEEKTLVEAWNGTDYLHDSEEPEPANGDASSAHGADETVVVNEGAEAEGDDDMMDRISSSPSIDDGGFHFSLPSRRAASRWPRFASLSPTPLSPPGGIFNRAASTSYVSPPASPPPRPLLQESLHDEGAPLRLSMLADSPSPFRDPQKRFSLANGYLEPIKFALNPNHRHHHHLGRSRHPLARDLEALPDMDPFGPLPGSEPEALLEDANSPRRRPSGKSQGSIALPSTILDLHHAYLVPSPSLSSIIDFNIEDILLPKHDPLLMDSPHAKFIGKESSSGPQRGPIATLVAHKDEDNDDDDDDAQDPFIDSHSPAVRPQENLCLRQEIEDIDFEFVYALHTFVATVAGQANATKGDTMVLLDDSNSYWWLVRVLKDNNIGYLPAEHIETPTERLARLNKHRNIDLSATMLSDNSEKSRNPLKMAMRRRNARTVQFAAPTYVEASDDDYDTEDEDASALDPYEGAAQTGQSQQNGEISEEETRDEAEHVNDQSHEITPRSAKRSSFDREQAATAAAQIIDDPQLSPKLVDKTEAAPLKSRKRNTDSFLKDDNLETRKITLTPGLLREEQDSIESGPSESSRPAASFDELVQQVSPPEPTTSKKEGKEKKKEDKKKGGMLSGLFKSKKKDKKTKDESSARDSTEDKASVELASGEFSPPVSGEHSPIEKGTSPASSDTDLTQQPPPQFRANNNSAPVHGKLQKAIAATEGLLSVQESSREVVSAPAPDQQTVPPPARDATQPSVEASIPHGQTPSDIKEKDGPLAPIANMLRSRSLSTPGDRHKIDVKPTKARRSKKRVELDDFDSFDEDIEDDDDIYGQQSVMNHAPKYDRKSHGDVSPESMTSSSSIVERAAQPAKPRGISALDDSEATPRARSPQPPGAFVNESDYPHDQPLSKMSMESTDTASSSLLTPGHSASLSQQSWSDHRLRSWLDDGNEVRDLLILINDDTDVTPVGPEHPLMHGLFVEPQRKLDQLSNELDDLFNSYMERHGHNLM